MSKAQGAVGNCSFLEGFKIYLTPASLRMFFLGFSSGLPLLLVLGTLSFWLREAGVDLTTIGFLSWVGLAYAFKWMWAPIVDRCPLPLLTRLLGRRRAWLVVSQLMLIAAISMMALTDPSVSLRNMAIFALLTAFSSATQDIALDAFRIESAQVEQQAALAAMYQTGYRLAMIWAGAGALALAAFAAGKSTGYDYHTWRFAYFVMACSMGVGFLTTLLSPEPRLTSRPIAAQACSWREKLAINFITPFKEFFLRFGWWALAVLALIATYRVSDIVMGVMANPFYQDLGFSKQEVAAVSKIFGVIMTLLGAFLGGVVTMRIGVMKTLMLGAILSSCTNFLFSVLAQIGHSLPFLIVTVSADNLAAGLASAAFVAYLSGLTCHAYSATQYALFSSVMLLLPKFLAGFSGLLVESLGYSGFFIMTAIIGVPVFVLVYLVHRFVREKKGDMAL